MTQTNEPTKRPKNLLQEDDEWTTMLIPKETGDDMNNPDAMLHRYEGEDSPFASTSVEKETRRHFVVKGKTSELLAHRHAAEQEAKDRVKTRAGIKGTSEIARHGAGIPMDALVADLKGRVLKELSDANG